MLVPVSHAVGVQGNAHVAREIGGVGVDDSEVHIQSKVLVVVVEGGMMESAVAQTSTDLLGLTESQGGVSGPGRGRCNGTICTLWHAVLKFEDLYVLL